MLFSHILYSVLEINPELQLLGFNETDEKLISFVGNQIILYLPADCFKVPPPPQRKRFFILDATHFMSIFKEF